MKSFVGNLFDYEGENNVLVIPINLVVKKDGKLVMGAGVAKEAARLHPELPLVFGHMIAEGNDFPFHVTENGTRYLGVPTKKHYREATSPERLELCVDKLGVMATKEPEKEFFSPLLGAGHGGLSPNYVFRVMKMELYWVKNITVVLTGRDLNGGIS